MVDDYESLVHGVVDYIDDVTYEIKRQEMEVPINQTDGMGLMLDGPTRMCRLSWIKGLMVQFPFDEFIREHCPEGDCTVYDIYGKPHKIIAEGIRYIFTSSQFKAGKYYDSWDEYKYYFKLYNCEACYCNIEEEYIPKARINYQMLQTLSDMTDAEIEKLVAPTVQEIDSIGQDFKTTMSILGATEYNTNPTWFQEALMIYPELFRDLYSREVLKDTKKSLIKQAKAGRLRVNGRYRFVCPDLVAFAQWLFLGDLHPKGLLANGEVYVNEFDDGDELACLRSPHLYREWPIRANRRSQELDRWFGGTQCVYVSTFDLISRILQFDNDGDKLLVIKDRLLTRVAKRNMEDIVPLYYEMKKAKGGLITNEALYQGMTKAYVTGNIGPISNNISRVWSSGHKIAQQELDAVKWLVMENNYVIDAAKTLYTPTRPKAIDKIIKSYTKAKLPHFFVYAKDKTEHQVENINDSVMNRISTHIPSNKVRYSKSVSKFDYRMLMNPDYDFTVSSESQVIRSYDYWNKRQYLIRPDTEMHQKQEDVYMYQQFRLKIIEETERPLGYIVNSLVAFLYTVRNSSMKKMLWACFGDVIVENIKRNLANGPETRICEICGKRFEPSRVTQIYCSKDCYIQADREKARIRKSSYKTQSCVNVEESILSKD